MFYNKRKIETSQEITEMMGLANKDVKTNKI